MNTTTNYKLKKPGTGDKVLIGDLNDNADTLDSALKSVEAVATGASTTATNHVANTTIHVTAEDKANWNGKADASDIPNVDGMARLDTSQIFTGSNTFTKPIVGQIEQSWEAGRLTTARNINMRPFDGTQDINIACSAYIQDSVVTYDNSTGAESGNAPYRLEYRKAYFICSDPTRTDGYDSIEQSYIVTMQGTMKCGTNFRLPFDFDGNTKYCVCSYDLADAGGNGNPACGCYTDVVSMPPRFKVTSYQNEGNGLTVHYQIVGTLFANSLDVPFVVKKLLGGSLEF